MKEAGELVVGRHTVVVQGQRSKVLLRIVLGGGRGSGVRVQGQGKSSDGGGGGR